MNKKAIIISIKGLKLSYSEKKLLSKENPWGLILFKRNIKSFKQITALVRQIRKLTKDPKFPVLIDEEGSSVSRLSDIINHTFSQKLLGDIYNINPKFWKFMIYKWFSFVWCNSGMIKFFYTIKENSSFIT